MNMFSWKYPLIVLCTVGLFGACSSSDSKKSSGDGSTCGNGTVESNEDCEGTSVGTATCKTALMNQSATGTLKCHATTCKFDTSGCTTGGTGGSTGSGGSTGAGGGTGTGGDAGAEAGTGGSTSTGGSTATGGSTSTGGSTATGGTTSDSGTG